MIALKMSACITEEWVVCCCWYTIRNQVSIYNIYILMNTCLVLIRVECMYLSKTTLSDDTGMSNIYYIRYNYVFRRLTMAIFRLYMKYSVSNYTRLNMGCIQRGGTG